MRNCSNFNCTYINKPYCTLRPISSITPCPRFSCPAPQHFCPQQPFPFNNDFCPNCCLPYMQPAPPCFPQPPCNLNNNLIWFLGGFGFGSSCARRISRND